MTLRLLALMLSVIVFGCVPVDPALYDLPHDSVLMDVPIMHP